MNATVKITKIGNSAGVVLPKELLAGLRAGVGDTLYVTEAPDDIRITVINPEFEAKMALAETIMRQNRDILRVPANSIVTSPEPVRIEIELALAIHDRQLAEHGGPVGLRDWSLLESALARPQNQWSYRESDPCALGGVDKLVDVALDG